ncbi:purine/pyrimidine permease [Pontibacillus litoralis]|uniref:Xanthine permease n=1 Tax=Pontibacillus litoralis JSM 072002 TaxID=1385512 RepID=A0A0A5G3J7_9BACI|nr:purine/pyrimidine permease [Pontibacillus litoralis]KGX85655.1 xanthine permease [Pontibacillus litoralis JSM 072002]
MKGNSAWRATSLETLQWLIFFLASSVALPIVVGAMFALDSQEVAGLMQRTLFVVGLASLLQGLFGHRLPVMEGPAGIWVSIFAVMATTAAQHGDSPIHTLQVLQFAIILTGIFLFLFGVMRLSSRVLFFFTPLVTGGFLFLLTVQLSGTFLQGMLGITSDSPAIQPVASIVAFLTFFFVLGMSIFGQGWRKSYAVLIGIVIGWILYAGCIGVESSSTGNIAVFSVPELFAWGLPVWDLGVVPIAFMTAVILLSNLVAALVGVSDAVYDKPNYTYEQMNKGSMMVGISHGLSGIWSTIANVPLASSAGFIELTGQKRKKPFLYASVVLMVLAFFPPMVQFISQIPAPVANAALLATFVQLMGLGLRNIASEPFDQRRLTILAVSFLIGIGIMFLPSEAFTGFPSVLQNIASNGLLVGTLLIMILERTWKE